MTYKEAREATKESGKLLLVDATAVWCGPCKQMDKTTWVDEEVVAWIGEHAVAIQIDVDQEKELSEELQIRAMPTVIVFKDGELFDRTVGYKNAEDLIAWIDGVRGGEREIDRLEREAGDRVKADGTVDVMQRYMLARKWVEDGAYDKATAEYVWLWENAEAYEPGMSGVRVSFMAGDMAELAGVHEPARRAFVEFRDALAAQIEAKRYDMEVLMEWVVMNEIVGEVEATLAWFDRVKEKEGYERMIRMVGNRLDRELIERGRWADIPYVHADPIGSVRRAHWLLQMSADRDLPEDMRDREEEMTEASREFFRRSAGELYAGYLAAGYDEDAASIAKEAIGLDDTARMRIALVETALEAGEAREVFYEMLDAAQEEGEAVQARRKRVEKMLAQGGGEE